MKPITEGRGKEDDEEEKEQELQDEEREDGREEEGEEGKEKDDIEHEIAEVEVLKPRCLWMNVLCKNARERRVWTKQMRREMRMGRTRLQVDHG
mmetsp:Transcript_2030/g.2817  ORF Transcript_2030/g.2817 Transcript_2030/m.2817 type:complete len:94 (+) Transcript_2030:452-733(+)